METHGLTNDRAAFFDNPDAALGLREVKLDSPICTATEGPTDELGRPVIALPDQSLDTDPELYEKSPDEIVAILQRREAEADNRSDYMGDTTENLTKAPGDPQKKSSSGGSKIPKKPRPPEAGSNTRKPVTDVEPVLPRRPHLAAGRVSTEALHGLNSSTASIGEIMNQVGETLFIGVGWSEVSEKLKIAVKKSITKREKFRLYDSG